VRESKLMFASGLRMGRTDLEEHEGTFLDYEHIVWIVLWPLIYLSKLIKLYS